MDIQKLNQLLDNQRSYMKVSKSLFLESLKREFDSVKKNEIHNFDRIVNGVCNSCNKGGKAYKFITNDNHTLDLFIEEKNGNVTDIYLCNDLKTQEKIAPDYNLYFFFYEDQETDFKPSVNFLIKKQKIDEATAHFLSFQGKTISIQDLIYWKTKFQEATEEFESAGIFDLERYKLTQDFSELCIIVNDVIKNEEQINMAKQAMFEYSNITSEKELVYWLLTYEKQTLWGICYERKIGWEQTGLISFKKFPSISIDCTNYIEALQLTYWHSKHNFEITEKYAPNFTNRKEPRKEIEYSLVAHLRFSNKYLDLLPE